MEGKVGSASASAQRVGVLQRHLPPSVRPWIASKPAKPPSSRPMSGTLWQAAQRHTLNAVLNSLSFLKKLDPVQRGKIADALQSVTFHPGERLVTFGEEGRAFFVIMDGTVRVIGREGELDTDPKKEVCELGPGECIGELEFINGHPCVADVVAETEVRAAQMSKSRFEHIIKDMAERVRTAHGLEEANEADPKYQYYRQVQNVHRSSYHKGWWPKTLNPFLKFKAVSLIGAPLADGQEIGGVDKGPASMRAGGVSNVAEALGWRWQDRGDVDFAKACKGTPDIEVSNVQNCARLGRALGALHHTVAEEAKKGNFVLTIGGDHSIASATISGIKAAHKDLCVVWVDAHGDCNTPDTSPSAHYHGMPAAHVMGWFKGKSSRLPCFEWLTKELMVPAQRIAFVGMRDLDQQELRLMSDEGANVWTMHEVDKWGIGQVMQMALHRINPRKDRPIHLSFDVDGCDPLIAPGTGTCSRGGLSYRESHYIIETVCMTQCLVSMDLVEINPDLDIPVTGRMHGDDPKISAEQMTTRLGIELVASALGKGMHGGL